MWEDLGHKVFWDSRSVFTPFSYIWSPLFYKNIIMCMCVCSQMSVRGEFHVGCLPLLLSTHWTRSSLLHLDYLGDNPYPYICPFPPTGARLKMGFLHFKWSLRCPSPCRLDEACPHPSLHGSWCSFEMTRSGVSWWNLTVNSSATVTLTCGNRNLKSVGSFMFTFSWDLCQRRRCVITV